MYLKSIDILGFKSFPEKTCIEVKPGITGVIGPNGCGKSNIVDALRWCIGEMSLKSLRSDSMVSVIFHGTERRNPMGLAEVTLTFDNTRGMLPVQYTEVQVARRIFRSGESEYHLNKTQCRLRDIRELFLDTGIGNGGYAIIDQGQVDFALSAKPEERRELFEEAAGVAKYKSKKDEAVRKMDRVEIDLGRLQDSVSLISEQIKKLDADARKAKLYQKYKTELTSLEAGQILKEIGEIDTGLAGEAERTAPLSEKLSALRVAVDADDARLAALNLERTRQDEAVSEARQKAADIKSEIGRLEERVANARTESEERRGQLSKSEGELEGERGRAAGMEPDIERARRESEEAAGVVETSRAGHESSRSELAGIEEERETLSAELEGLGADLLAVVEAGQQAGREVSATESRIGKLEWELQRNAKESAKKGEQLDVGRMEAEGQERAVAEAGPGVERAREEVAGLERAQAGLRAQLSEASEEALRLHAEAAGLEAQIKTLEAQGGKDPYWVGAHALADAGIPGIAGTVRSLLEVDDSHHRALEDALGERLHAVVCADMSSARAGIEFLKGCGLGRARFLVADALPEGGRRGALQSVEGAAHQELEGHAAAAVDAARPADVPAGARSLLELIRFDPAHEPVMRHLLSEAHALDGGLYGGHWVCGGALEGEPLQLKLADIGTLRERLGALEGERESLAATRSEREREQAANEERLIETRARRDEESARFHTLAAELRQAGDGLKLLEEESEAIRAERERLEAELSGLREELSAARSRLDGRRKEEGSLRDKEREREGRRAELNEEVTKRRARQEALAGTLEQLEQQHSLKREKLDGLVRNREEVQRTVARLAEQRERWEARLRDLARIDTESNERLGSLKGELAGRERESNKLSEALQRIRMEADGLDAKVKRDKSEADDLRERLHKSELRVSQLAGRRQNLTGRLETEWELGYEEARERYKDQPVDEERIEFLRRRMIALGQVNPAAPEEYEEFIKKRDYLQGQIDDLNQAKQDLRSVISKINSATRENFRQTFSEVQEHFRKLYGVLFDGGEADLVMTDPEDLLVTGIDVVAQPPGKRLQSISQLSGGEKALTAIALLFAFFMVRPSPICMLDEADAALDDANVERFVSLLKEFVERTQFLIVSHNKKTMEACDAIYGITMEESGVSQLISIDFRKKGAGAAAEGEATAKGAPVADAVAEGDRHGAAAAVDVAPS